MNMSPASVVDARANPVPSRKAWLDAARAIAVVLVVIGHCLRGLTAAGTLNADAANADRIIYSVHIPLFFLISGMLFSESIKRRTFMASWKPRMMRLIKPYVLWSVILLALIVLAAHSANAPVSIGQALSGILLLPVQPVSIFWFLYTLIICTAVSGLALEYFRLTPGQLLLWSAALHAVYLMFLTDQQSGWGLQFVRFAEHQLYFALGCFISSLASVIVRPMDARVAGRIAGVGTAVFLLVITVMTIGRISYHSALGTAAALGGSAAILGGCYLLFEVLRCPLPGGMAKIATNSLAIFCMHVPFLAFIRIAALRMNIESGTLHLLLGTAAGLAGPLISLAILDQIGLSRFVGFDNNQLRQGRPAGGS